MSETKLLLKGEKITASLEAINFQKSYANRWQTQLLIYYITLHSLKYWLESDKKQPVTWSDEPHPPSPKVQTFHRFVWLAIFPLKPCVVVFNMAALCMAPHVYDCALQ